MLSPESIVWSSPESSFCIHPSLCSFHQTTTTTMHNINCKVSTLTEVNQVDNFFEVGRASCLKLLLTPLGGSGGMPPRKFLAFSCSEIASGAILLVEN